MNKRFENIDFLRAVSIIGVVVIHTLVYNRISQSNIFIWNYLNFVVASFVFCSGYVLIAFYREKFTSVAYTLSWYKKRIIRLLFPFYVYLLAHLILVNIFPNLFSGLGLKTSINFITSSALLIGGLDLNWLPLLFLQLTILVPLLTYLLEKKKTLYIYVIFALVITLIITFFKFPFNYRLVMWIPWSLIILLSIYLFTKEKTEKVKEIINRYLKIIPICFGIFAGLFLLFTNTNRPLFLIDHKYPPDFYNLTYSVGWTLVVLALSYLPFLKIDSIKKVYTFISSESYVLFFVHYIFLDLVITYELKQVVRLPAGLQFLMIFLPSLVVCLLIKKISRKFLK